MTKKRRHVRTDGGVSIAVAPAGAGWLAARSRPDPLASQFSTIFHAGYHVCPNAGLGFYGASISNIRCVMAVLDLGFGSFVSIVALGIAALLAAYRH